MKIFTSMDLDVAVTELDVRTVIAEESQTTREQQGKIFSNVVRACKSVSRCVGVTIWDFSDKYSWGKAPNMIETVWYTYNCIVPETFKGEGFALPWTENMTKKNLYNAILEAWRS
jgi:endo-1,4-beta-xylanase